MAERLDLAYGHRNAATPTALFLKLEKGEIGLVTSDKTLWMRDYNDEYFQVKGNSFNILDYPNWSAANTAALAVGGTVLFPSGNYTLVGADFTFTANVKFMPGAIVDGPHTLTFNGKLIEEGTQLFGSSITIRFGGNSIPEFNPWWWGATAEGLAHDDSIAINKMFEVMASVDAGTPTSCFFPLTNSFYACASPLVIGKSNCTFRGLRPGKSPQGLGASIRYTAAGSSLDFFQCDGSYNRILDLCFFGNNTTGAVVKMTNNYKSRLQRCAISNRQENLGIASGPGYVFNGTGVYFAGDGSTYANGESGMEDCFVRGCDKGVRAQWGADGYLTDNIIIDCYHYCIGSEDPGAIGGWLVNGNKCYNSVASGVKLIKVAQLFGLAFGKVYQNEWEMTDADPVSGASYCIGVHIKTGGQEGSLVADNLIYTQYDNGHHFLIECTNANDVIQVHHNYCGAKAGKVNTIAFDFAGSFKGNIDCDDNFTHDCTTSYTTATNFWKIRRSDIATEGWTFSKDDFLGASKLVSLSTKVADATGNLFGIEQTVEATDNSAIFGYTFSSVRGLANVILNIASGYLARAGQFITTLSGAFGTTGSVYGSYSQITDSRSGGTSSEYNSVGGLINHTGAGGITLTRAFYALFSFGSSSGAVANHENFEADSPIRSGGTHIITNSYGFRSKAQKQSFVTNGFGFYQEGASDINRFAGITEQQNDFKITTLGKGLSIKAGTNGKINLGNVLVAGTVTVANTSVTANTVFNWNRVVSGGTLGHITITRNAGVGYTITSSSAAETSTIDVVLLEAT